MSNPIKKNIRPIDYIPVKRNKKISTEEYIKKVIAKHGEYYDLSNVEYVNSTTKVEVMCYLHGDFKITASQLVNGGGCKKCVNHTAKGLETKHSVVRTISDNLRKNKDFISTNPILEHLEKNESFIEKPTRKQNYLLNRTTPNINVDNLSEKSKEETAKRIAEKSKEVLLMMFKPIKK